VLSIVEPLLLQIEQRRRSKPPISGSTKTLALTKVPGVDLLTALTFVLTIADKGPVGLP